MLERKIRQFLVHSFLYYQLDESIIGDHEYDMLVTEIMEFIQDDYIYKSIIENSLGAEGSGFSIRKYPQEIISTSLHLLYQQKYKQTKTFEMFYKSYGYAYEKNIITR
jgi:NAD-dependent DNA ligase